MSENIVRYAGDSTTRQLWENGPTAATGFSRVLSPGRRNFSMVAFQQAKPLLDSELNLVQQIQNKLRADLVRTMLKPGIITINMETNITDKKNTVRLSNGLANMNGWFINLYGQNRNDNKSDIIFPAAPYNGTREDLAFLECWFEEVAPTGSPEDDSESVYKYGGVNSGTVANDILDPTAEDETTRRIQLRWNIRTVTDVNFTNYPNGVDNSARVKAKGGNSTETDYAFTHVGDGLYRAGDGSNAACTALHCVDGYVYAIPLIRAHRRNQTAYDAVENPYGAPAYGSGVEIPTRLYHDVIDAQDIQILFPAATAYQQGGDYESEKAIMKELFQQVRQQGQELETWKNQRIQQGVATISNKFVISGAVINAIAGTRNVKVTKTGTYAAGNYSLLYVDGHIISITDTQDSVAAVPTNDTAESKTYYAYIDGSGENYTVQVGGEVPTGKLGLYRIIVPAGDSAANLNSVIFKDIRRVESNYRNFYNVLPSVHVDLPYYAIGTNYGVELAIESTANNRNTVVEVTAKYKDYFIITSRGEADNIFVRWTLKQPKA